MPLFNEQQLAQFRRELETTTTVAFTGIVLPATHFEGTDGVRADIMFKRLDDRNGCVLLVSEDIRYIGSDRNIQIAFANAIRNGWRPLTVLRSKDPGMLLRCADAYLGLDGHPPRLIKESPDSQREIVVKADELAPQNPGGPDKEIDRFGLDLVDEARRGLISPPLFRDKEIAAVVRILSKANKNGVCLVGQPGVGKTAVVEGLALAVAHDEVPEALAQSRILEVNLSLLAAGATYQNEFEGRMKDILDLARKDRNVILFLDELHTIRAPGSNASQMVKADLGRGRIRCIGATTNTEFRILEADAALVRRFQVVPVLELSPAQSVDILRTCRSHLEQHHGVIIPDELLSKIVDLATRYVPDRCLPDKAIDLLDEACACARFQEIQQTQ